MGEFLRNSSSHSQPCTGSIYAAEDACPCSSRAIVMARGVWCTRSEEDSRLNRHNGDRSQIQAVYPLIRPYPRTAPVVGLEEAVSSRRINNLGVQGVAGQ